MRKNNTRRDKHTAGVPESWEDLYRLEGRNPVRKL